MLASLLYIIAATVASTASWSWLYQPKTPKYLLKSK
ncbi:cyclic lactone autoinducer peptide [Pseudobacteroides sp.]